MKASKAVDRIVKSSKSGTVIKTCSCWSEFQDDRYGFGKRVHNIMAKSGNDPQQCRCTVCGSTKQV